MKSAIAKQISLILVTILVLSGCEIISGLFTPPDPLAPRVQLSFDGTSENTGTARFDPEEFGNGLTYVAGVTGQAMRFDGTADWIDVPMTSALSFDEGASVSLWVSHEDWLNTDTGSAAVATVVNVDGMVIEFDYGRTPGEYELGFTLGTFWGGTATSEYYSLNPIPAATWVHVVLVYDAPVRVGRFYVNGILDVELSDVAGPVDPATAPNPIRIGTWFETNQALRGSVDDVRIYDYPLSEDQISALYEGGV